MERGKFIVSANLKDNVVAMIIGQLNIMEESSLFPS